MDLGAIKKRGAGRDVKARIFNCRPKAPVLTTFY